MSIKIKNSIVAMPRLIVTSDPRVAQRADDLLRTLVIADIHILALCGTGLVLMIQWLLLFKWFLSSPIFLAMQMLIMLLWLLCFMLSGTLRTRDKGRLGGKITGWSWQRQISFQ